MQPDGSMTDVAATSGLGTEVGGSHEGMVNLNRRPASRFRVALRVTGVPSRVYWTTAKAWKPPFHLLGRNGKSAAPTTKCATATRPAPVAAKAVGQEQALNSAPATSLCRG